MSCLWLNLSGVKGSNTFCFFSVQAFEKNKKNEVTIKGVAGMSNVCLCRHELFRPTCKKVLEVLKVLKVVSKRWFWCIFEPFFCYHGLFLWGIIHQQKVMDWLFSSDLCQGFCPNMPKGLGGLGGLEGGSKTLILVHFWAIFGKNGFHSWQQILGVLEMVPKHWFLYIFADFPARYVGFAKSQLNH